MMNTYLAVDFGGGSGRVMAGSICQGTLKLKRCTAFQTVRCGWETMCTGIFWLCLMR